MNIEQSASGRLEGRVLQKMDKQEVTPFHHIYFHPGKAEDGTEDFLVSANIVKTFAILFYRVARVATVQSVIQQN